MDDNDDLLWQNALAGVKPLKGNHVKTAVQPPAKRTYHTLHTGIRPRDPIFPTPNRQPGGRELDKNTAERLRKGKIRPDRTLDLHGETQASAERLLRTVIIRAYERHERCILVITGKGPPPGSEPPPPGERVRGVLRRVVPEWLAAPPLNAIVLHAVAARPEDGGAGALYVFLRRHR